VLDARHGRVLFHSVNCYSQPWVPTLALWDPFTGERRELPRMPRVPDPYEGSSNFVVLCAAAGCNHLDCSHGPFLVVAVVFGHTSTFARVYSSEDGEWGEATLAPHINQSLGRTDSLDLVPGALAGDAVYFQFHTTDAVVKFDLTTREMVLIHLPDIASHRPISLVTTEDGGLGFAVTKDSMLYLWSRVTGPGKQARWEQSRVIELEKILPATSLKHPPIMLGSVDIIFLYTNDGKIFSVDLKSSQARVMPRELGLPDYVVPFVSFCTPALGAATTDKEPGASASSA